MVGCKRIGILTSGGDAPGMNAAIRADANLRDVYLVAVSGYGTQEDLKRSCDSGFDHHMTKPVSKSDLATMMSSMPRFPKHPRN